MKKGILIIILLVMAISIVFNISVKSCDIQRIEDSRGNIHSFVFIFLNQGVANYMRLDSPDILSVSFRNFSLNFFVPGPIMDLVFVA